MESQTLEFRDQQDRGWSSRWARGRLISWSLRSAAGEPLASLQREENGFRLQDRRRRLEVQWREVAAEPLRKALEKPETPSSYRQDGCFAGAG